ncbi:MAG TPA: ParB/RepB/Spo0J family partition protein [Pyrinomonadaceae bacterium]|nr:ParB/RepB/Spo0J family partition protein [Pyrinomonadaceae bacterium]
MSKRGLPAGIRMRHDSHYVEELAGQRPTPVGRFIPLDRIDPNPEQPRVEFGDLEELTASIREKGVLEPLLVSPQTGTGRWIIVAGERRWRAAQAAGLREVPCVELDVDEQGIAEIALVENMQRKDLTPWEEADGLFALCHKFGYTHEDVARKVGKSRTSVTESLAIAALPEGIREECRRADISAKTTLLQVARQPDLDSMRGLIGEIERGGLGRDGARAARKSSNGAETADPATGRRKKEGGARFKYELPARSVKLELRFPQEQVGREEVIGALREMLAELEGGRET